MRAGLLAIVTATPASSLTVMGKAVASFRVVAAAVEAIVDRVEEAIAVAAPGVIGEEVVAGLLATVWEVVGEAVEECIEEVDVLADWESVDDGAEAVEAVTAAAGAPQPVRMKRARTANQRDRAMRTMVPFSAYKK